MRVVFAGTPPFATRALDALARAGHEIPLVLTQPDRPAGRGMQLMASAVGKRATELGLALFKPASLKDRSMHDALRAARGEVMVVAAYGLLLPPAVLEIPGHGCLNIHASLLPRWRGAAPIQRALLAGDARTGISIMQMEAGLDTGPVLLEKTLAIAPRDTAGSLTESLAALGADAIVEALERLHQLQPRLQDESLATYAPKITKQEVRIDWSAPARLIDRQVRAFNPRPGAETALEGQTLKIWTAEALEGTGSPGRVVSASAEGLVVGCGEGVLRISSLQRAGGRRLSAAEFLRGFPIDRVAALGG